MSINKSNTILYTRACDTDIETKSIVYTSKYYIYNDYSKKLPLYLDISSTTKLPILVDKDDNSVSI